MNKTTLAPQAKITGLKLPSKGILQRKCVCGSHTIAGGECEECKKNKRLDIQTKLKINEPNDIYEEEADRIADQVMTIAEPKKFSWGRTANRVIPHLQQKPMGLVSNSAPSLVNNALQSPGNQLDPETRFFMESRFGYDFSQVRVHTDKKSADSAQAINARAYTVGSDVVFGQGQFQPGSNGGRSLLAHELVHVIQQNGGSGSLNNLGRKPLVIQGSDGKQIMREQLHTGTLQICHQYLRSRRNFQVTQGGLRVTVNAHWGPEHEGDPMPVGCESDRPPFSIELRDVGAIFDSPWGTCEFAAGRPSSRQWTNLPSGEYYLGINTPDTGPYCCLSGSIEVFQERGLTGDTCTQPPPGPLEMLHDALALAGLIPALGAIPDAIDTGIYVIQGEWGNAGLSAIAIVPVLGDGFSLGRIGARAVVRAEAGAVRRLGSRRIAQRLREARTSVRAAIRAIPQGFTERQFTRFARGARRLRRQARLPQGELVVHGSRVSGIPRTTPRPDLGLDISDIDVALRVDDATFFELAERVLARARPGTRLRETMLDRIRRNGQLSSFDLGTEFQSLRRELLDAESPVPVQFSVLRRGGRLDTGPFLPLE